MLYRLHVWQTVQKNSNQEGYGLTKPVRGQNMKVRESGLAALSCFSFYWLKTFWCQKVTKNFFVSAVGHTKFFCWIFVISLSWTRKRTLRVHIVPLTFIRKQGIHRIHNYIHNIINSTNCVRFLYSWLSFTCVWISKQIIFQFILITLVNEIVNERKVFTRLSFSLLVVRSWGFVRVISFSVERFAE